MKKQHLQTEGIFYGWWIVAVCFLLLFLFAGAGFYSFSIFIKPIEEEFGWDRAAISLTMSINFLMGGVAGPFIGKVIQRFGVKIIMIVGAICAGGCYMLVSLTQSLWYFYSIYALLALFSGGIGVIPASNLIARWFDRSRGTATGIAMVGIAAGGLILAPIVGVTTSCWGWKSSFLFIGVLVWVLALPAICIFIKEYPADMGLLPYAKAVSGQDRQPVSEQNSDPATQVHIAGCTSGEAFRSCAFRWMATGFFLAPLAQMGVLQHQVPIVVDSGISQTAAATALGITAGMGGIGKLSFGRISETLPMQWVFALCFGLQALAVFILLHTTTIALLYVYVVIFGFAMGGVIVLMPLAVGKFFGLASFGVIFGTIWFIHTIGGALGTFLAGLIYDYMHTYQYALYAFIAAYILAACALMRTGNPQANTDKYEKG